MCRVRVLTILVQVMSKEFLPPVCVGSGHRDILSIDVAHTETEATYAAMSVFMWAMVAAGK